MKATYRTMGGWLWPEGEDLKDSSVTESRRMGNDSQKPLCWSTLQDLQAAQETGEPHLIFVVCITLEESRVNSVSFRIFLRVADVYFFL